MENRRSENDHEQYSAIDEIQEICGLIDYEMYQLFGTDWGTQQRMIQQDPTGRYRRAVELMKGLYGF